MFKKVIKFFREQKYAKLINLLVKLNAWRLKLFVSSEKCKNGWGYAFAE